jgi:di/tricarboxylate transporter
MPLRAMEHFFILGLILGALVLFALEIVKPDVVALGVLLVLAATGTVAAHEVFSGFANPAVITVIAMFILSAGLVRSGVADWIGALLLRVGSGSPALLTFAVMGTVGIMSAFMNNIGAVAVLMPAMFVVARKAQVPASKLLIPLAFGSLLGGLTTLIGTPPNLLVSMALEEHGFAPFRMFDFAPTGLAVMAVGALYMAFAGRHLIPKREAAGLTDQYELKEFLSEILIPEGSPLVGKSIRESDLRRDAGITVLRIKRNGRMFAPGPLTLLKADDHLLVEGNVREMLKLKEAGRIEIASEARFGDEELIGDEAQLAELALAPGSSLIGQSIRQIDFRRRFEVLVLAMRRKERTVRTNVDAVPLDVGTVLLVQGSPEALRELARRGDFLVVNLLEHEPRAVRKAPVAVAIMAGAVIAAATGLLHISVAGLAGALLMVLAGCVKAQDMYRHVEWRVIFLISCMMPLGTAMDESHTGTARWLAEGVVGWVGDSGPLVAMACLFWFTAAITSVMSNAAAAVLLAPIGIAMARGLAVDPHAFLMTIAIGASTTFLTPIGHQANVLVYGLGRYRFLDFPRVGAALTLLVFAVTMLLVPVVWPLSQTR